MGRRLIATLTAGTLALGGVYVTLDALDIVPGALTTRPAIPDPVPYPSLSPAERSAPELLASATPAPAGDVNAAVDSLVNDERMGTLVGVSVIDGATGEMIAERNGEVPMPPASSTKVLTAAAALSTLGPETRLATTATLSGDVVTLVGGGDILLTTGEANDGANGHASLTDLAAQAADALRASGIAEVTVAVDQSLFSGDAYSPEWGPIDAPWVMPISSVAVNRGQITGTSYFPDPALSAAAQFAAELSAAGIAVTGTPSHAASPADARTIGVVRSASVEEIVHFMTKISDNSVTEVMGRLTALALGYPGTFTGATAAVTQSLETLGLPVDGLTLYDVCGLSSNNLITSDLLARTVQLSLSEPALTSLITSFPVMHLDGTLKDRGEDAAGFVRAKTGTLVHAVSLTGIIQTDGGALLTFSAIASDVEYGGVASARRAIDVFVAGLKASL